MMYEKEWENPNYKFLSYDLDNLNWHIHYHESFEICFIIEGEINITIDTVCYNLKRGDSVIIFPRQLHSYETAQHSKMRVITFMPDLIPEFTNCYKNMLPEKNDIKGLADFKQYFDAPNIFAQKGLLYSVLGILAENTDFKEAASSDESQLLLKILRYIEKNFKTPCFLQTAAEELSYGYSYLSRTFKKRMGMSYTEYLNKYRINRALYMLGNKRNMQIQQIAEECGYDSLCSFNRNFKYFTGYTPREMMKERNINDNQKYSNQT